MVSANTFCKVWSSAEGQFRISIASNQNEGNTQVSCCASCVSLVYGVPDVCKRSLRASDNSVAYTCIVVYSNARASSPSDSLLTTAGLFSDTSSHRSGIMVEAS